MQVKYTDIITDPVHNVSVISSCEYDFLSHEKPIRPEYLFDENKDQLPAIDRDH